MKKLTPKNSFITLYKRPMLNILLCFAYIISIFAVFGIFGIIYFYYTKELFIILVLLFSVTCLHIIYEYSCFLWRQRNIPLTKEELDSHNIKTVRDYQKFLYIYLKKYQIRNRTLQKICHKSAFYYLLNEEERKKRLELAHAYLNDDQIMLDYLAFSKEEKSFSYAINDYKENKIDSVFDLFPDDYCPHFIDSIESGFMRHTNICMLIFIAFLLVITYPLM